MACLLLWVVAARAFAMPVDASLSGEGAIGLSTAYFREGEARLTLEEAVVEQGKGAFTAGSHAILNFGIGSRPVWIHFRVDNPTAEDLPRRLSIETAWLDRVEVHVLHRGRLVAIQVLGDEVAYRQRPVDSRFLGLDHAFAPGVSDVYLRVETPDPMVVPLHLLALPEAHARQEGQDYSYGFLYGFLFALLAYNATLDAGLRNARYILYSLYLATFMLVNVAYTGHGLKWFWPQLTGWAQWANPVLMVLFGISGLSFALRFLDIPRHFPSLYRAVVAYLVAVCGLLAMAVLLDHRAFALLTAFTFVFLFTWIMLGLGLMAFRSGQKPALYFLLATIAGSLGAGVTALAVWGFIPYSVWTFRAVEMGMLLDATLLAVALVHQFRVGQQERLRAEQLAQQDPLTGLNNRRAFYDRATAIWQLSARHERHVAVILLDIDHFKRINDTHGHARGDEVLVETARVLMDSIRQEDLVVRWGGEEFLLLLPETGLKEAVAMAERLRAEIAAIRLGGMQDETGFTASFGVAQRDAQHPTLETLISGADRYLYQSKQAGRNCVSHGLASCPA